MIKETWQKFIGGSVLAAVMSSAASAACVSVEELRADQMRFLDMQLRVAALQCRNRGNGFPGLYNAFVLVHKKSIQASRVPVEQYLARLSHISMDGYTTSLANRVSFESIKVKNFCEEAALSAVFLIELADPLDGLDLMPIDYSPPRGMCADTAMVLGQPRLGPATLR
ncbi:hypothetical protein [Kordiimonas aestuarii]|uniref:hypothetical protein n=1 Tax=Kordiimonas aestuarii TaxID=1005925 RepID=UPI0021CF6C8F|nr:hypothetical protein [Kordiimonas aestuarii]